MAADITIFKFKTVTGKTTFEDSPLYPEGIPYAFANPVVATGKECQTQARPKRA